jgi:hypothetical protein
MRFSGGVRFAVAMAMVVVLAFCAATFAADDAQTTRDSGAGQQQVVAVLSHLSLDAHPARRPSHS